MAAKLGRLFLNAALGSVSYAGRCIMARKVKTGLQELSSENLMGSLQRGIETVAKEVGLPHSYVTALLPADDLHALIDRIHNNQKICVEQWDVHTGHIGGLLDGVADLTIDRRPPDIGLCLLRLSRKMQMDKELSEPLRELSENLDSWRDLLMRCRTIIDDGKSLKAAYRKRRMLYALGVAAAVVSCVLAVAVGGVYWSARRRVDAVLADADGCAVEHVAASDLNKASSGQLALIDTKKKQCEQTRKEARAKLAAQRRQQERAQQQAKARIERERKCKQLADALKTHTLTDEALAAAPGHSGFIKRLFAARLATEDVRDELVLPCAGTAAAEAVEVAYAQAVMRARPYWLGKHLLSPQAMAMLTKHRKALAPNEVQILSWASDDRAKKSMGSGNVAAVQRAAQLCKLAEGLGLVTQDPCKIVTALAKQQ